jgi:YegS/Rv2252/BmrU family lipid kinase
VRYLLIVNPASGGGRRQPRLAKVLKYFRKRGDHVEVHETTGPHEAGTVARERGRGFDAVIAAGGDGTINEVVGGLAGTDVPLGILPWGTGNVFAREMGLPVRVKPLCKIIRKGRVARLDLGMADGRPFLLMASAGLDAYALQRTASTKKTWGRWAYLWAGLGALARYSSPRIEVELDGVVDHGSFVLISNTRLYGAFFVFFPQADPSDGYLDVLVFRDTGRWKFLGMALHMAWRQLTAGRSPRMADFMARHGVYRVRSLRMTSNRSFPVQADGEYLGRGVSAVSVSPGALKVLLPRY